MSRNYDFVRDETQALNDLMQALVEANIHANAARGRGWRVDFTVDDETCQIGVSVNRAGWSLPLEPET